MQNTDKHGRTQTEDESLIPKHGGYRQLKTFQLAEVIYDVTVLFCDRFISSRSRTHDQMVQAARSGRQNIAEGSVDSATSKKIELKLTGVAKGSLEELLLDYEDFLRQRNLPRWPPNHPPLTRFKARRCAGLLEFRAWVNEEVQRATQHTDEHRHHQTGHDPSVSVRGCPCSARDLPATLAANGTLSLLNLCIHLLNRQLEALATAFQKEGGFTERLYRQRMQRRREQEG